MKKILAIAVPVALALGALTFVWLRVLSVPAVQVVIVAPREFQARAFGTGTVEARVYVEVGSKITGRVVKLLRDQGDRVRQGDLLAVLENDDFLQQREQSALGRDKALESVRLEQATLARARATLEAKRAAINKALANADLAHVTLSRYRQLHERELIARQDLDVRSTELRVAEADVESLRAEMVALEAEVARSESAIRMAEREAGVSSAAVGVSESRLRDTSVLAPISGLILSREVEPGAVIVPGAPMFKMVDPTSVWVRINVDESLLGGLKVGQGAQVTLRGSPGKSFPGEVVRIGEESDRVTEELTAEVRLLEPPPGLRIGQQAEATIITRAAPAARVLPGTAVMKGPGGPAAFVVDGGRARLKPIAIRARDPRSGDVEVASGLDDGDQVVVGPPPIPSALKDGQRVKTAGEGGR